MNPSLKFVLSGFCTLILSILFLLAAFSKIGDLAGFHHSLIQITFLPSLLQGLALLVIPGLELSIAICLIYHSTRREAALLAIGLLATFLIFGIILNLTHSSSGCGCFKISLPTWLNLSGWWIVARNCLFLLMSILILQSKPCESAKQVI
jgi:hypothetical protein